MLTKNVICTKQANLTIAKTNEVVAPLSYRVQCPILKHSKSHLHCISSSLSEDYIQAYIMSLGDHGCKQDNLTLS